MTVNSKDDRKKESKSYRTCLINIDNVDSHASHEQVASLQLRPGRVEEKWGKLKILSCAINVSVCTYVRVCIMHKIFVCVLCFKTIIYTRHCVNRFRIRLLSSFLSSRIVVSSCVATIDDRRSSSCWVFPGIWQIGNRVPRQDAQTPRRFSPCHAPRKFKLTASSPPPELEQRLVFIAIICGGRGNGGKCNEVFRQIQFLLESRRYPYPTVSLKALVSRQNNDV